MKKLTSLLLTLAMMVSVCQFNLITASADGDIPLAEFSEDGYSITISNLPEDLENASLADDGIYDSDENWIMASLDSVTEISLPTGEVVEGSEYHFTITSNNYEDIVIYAVYGTVENPTANTAPTKKTPATALPDAVNGKITLTKNVNLAAMAVIRETTTIDLAGYTITGTSNGMAIGVASGTLTLMDSSSAKTGKIVVSGERSTAVLVYGTFIMNSGKLEVSGQDSSGIYIENGGSATMKNGSITATGMGAIGAAAVGSSTSATFTIENGTITAEGQGAIGIYLMGAEQNAVVSGGIITVKGDGSGYGIEAIEQGSTGHNITVSGGTINVSGTRTYAIYLEMDNTLKISKGTLTSADSAAVVFFQGGNTAEITGGTITGKTYGVNIANSANNTLSISGEAVLSGETGSVNAGGNRDKETPAVTISGGYFNGAVSGGVPSATDATYAIYNITGGYFTDEIGDSALYNYALAKDYTTETYTDEIKANETNELVSVSKTKDGVTYTYQVDEKKDYDTALPAAVDGKITLTRNVNLAATAVITSNTTLDLAGYTITGTSAGRALAVAGDGVTLALMDSSSAKTGKIVVSGEQSAAVIVNGAAFVMNSGKIEVSGQDSAGIYIQNGGSATMKNGSLTATGVGAMGVAVMGMNDVATFTLGNGEITAEGQGAMGIYLAGEGQKTVVSGGMITVNGADAYGISPVEIGSTGHDITVSGDATISVSGNRSYAINLETDNTLKITGGTLTSSDSYAVVFFQGGNKGEITGGTITGKTYGVYIRNSATNTLSISDEAVLSGETGSINAGGNRYEATPAVTITGGYFNGAVSGGIPSATDDTYAIYNITGGYFTNEISDSALYNYALAKDYTTETYTEEVKANETNELASVSMTKDGVTYTYQVTEKEAPAPETVTITFNAGDGSFGKDEEQQDIKIKIVTIEKGASLTEEQLPPVIPPTGYTFNGWGDITGKTVNESVSYTASYTIMSFTITWMLDENTKIDDTIVEYNVTPTHADASKAETDEYTYTFAGWTPAIVAATENATYTATFTPVTRKYTATFNLNGGNINGNTSDVEVQADYNTAPTPPENPIKDGYTFNGWSPAVSAITENTTFTAQWAENAPDTVTVTFNAGDGTFADATKTKNVTINKGASLTANDLPSVTPPTGYTFNGWGDITGKAVNESVTYTAKYTIKSFRITWMLDENTKIDETTVNYNVTPTHADASKAATDEYTYTFAGWTPTIVAATENATYTAQFDSVKRKYTITWNIDGAETNEDLEYGATPSHANPTKAEDENGKYSFKGWSPAIETVSKTQTYTAQFDLISKFTITYNIDDGTINGENYAQYYYVGEGATLPTNVTKNGYTFAGWYDNDEFEGEAVTTILASETGAKTYYADWTLNTPTEYLITFVNWDNTELQKSNVAVGITPQYTGATPTKTEDGRYTYEFIGWTPEITEVSGIATYKAEFKQYVKPVNNAATIEKKTDTNGTRLIVTPDDTNMTVINLYAAIYNANGSLKRVEMTRCSKNDNNIIVPLTEPQLENDETYKLMLWDISYSPIIQAITSSDNFFN